MASILELLTFKLELLFLELEPTLVEKAFTQLVEEPMALQEQFYEQAEVSPQEVE